MGLRLFSVEILIITVTTLASRINSECYDQKIRAQHFEVKCPEYNSNLKIICHSDVWTNFLIKLNVRSVSMIEFENCNFPETSSVKDIFQSMNVKVNMGVIFKKLPFIPNRKNLQGLSVTQLQLLHGNLVEIPYDLFYDVSDVRLLTIGNSNLVHIPEAFFADWAKNILEVNLTENKLQKISKNDFAQLVKLTVLDLSSNEIEDIESGAFDHLLDLHAINLGSNRLRTLSPHIFHRLSKLTNLDISQNFLDELPPDLLIDTKNLITFNMFKNHGSLKTLPTSLFKDKINLEVVLLNQIQLETLPTDLFAGCYRIQIIDLSNNELRRLPSGLLNDTVGLEYLNIANNRLEYLPSTIFKNLRRLKKLFLNGNKLSVLSQDILETLQAVEYFDASYNNLTRIDSRFMTYLKSALHINLSHNQLTFEISDNGIPENQTSNPMTLKQYKHIDLSYNNITQFDDYIMEILKESIIVDLSNNHISKINISEQSIKVVVSNRSHYELVNIKLWHNQIHCDCDLINFVGHLNGPYRREMLKMFFESYIFIQFLTCASPAELDGRSLRELRLEELNCPLRTSVPDDACSGTCECREWPETQVLAVNCSGRNLTRLPANIAIGGNWSIELNLTGNMLQEASFEGLSYCTKVTNLDLSNNNINEVTLDLFSPNLQHLKLHGNRLSHLDSNVIQYLAQNNTLRSITLHSNKWICDCKAREFLRFVQNTFTKYHFHEIICYGTNTKLYKMSESEICENIIAITVISSLCIAVLGIIATLVGLYYRYRQQIKVWLYSKQLCLWLVTEDELDKDKEYDAFISFSHKDEAFVEKEIISKLEKGSRPYKLCLHYRDWLAGEWIPLQISRSVAQSRRTIVVLTPNFLESAWGLIEFRTAYTQALKEGRARLIVILHGEIGNINDLDQEMKDYLRLNTYIKWGDPWFWDKLKYALPHGKEPVKRKSRGTEPMLPLANNSVKLLN